MLLLICSVSVWATVHVRGLFAGEAGDDEYVPRTQARQLIQHLQVLNT